MKSAVGWRVAAGLRPAWLIWVCCRRGDTARGEYSRGIDRESAMDADMAVMLMQMVNRETDNCESVICVREPRAGGPVCSLCDLTCAVVRERAFFRIALSLTLIDWSTHATAPHAHARTARGSFQNESSKIKRTARDARTGSQPSACAPALQGPQLYQLRFTELPMRNGQWHCHARVARKTNDLATSDLRLLHHSQPCGLRLSLASV